MKQATVCLEKCTVEPNSMMFLDVKLDDGIYCMPTLNVGNRKTINEGDRLRNEIMTISEVHQTTELRQKEPVRLEEINLEPDANEAQKEEIVDLLNKYRDCIAKNIFELNVELQIQMTEKCILCMP